MEIKFLQVKNMVCHRCILTVEGILSKAEIDYKKVALGEISLETPLKTEDLDFLRKEFDKVGFEILKDKNEKIINQIKSLIVKEVYGEDRNSERKLSEMLTSELHHDYSFLSSLFSDIEGISINQYHSNLIIERTKELLEYKELNINEIATKIGFKSASYLCTKFKKATGLTPVAYQKSHLKKRQGINAV